MAVEIFPKATKSVKNPVNLPLKVTFPRVVRFCGTIKCFFSLNGGKGNHSTSLLFVLISVAEMSINVSSMFGSPCIETLPLNFEISPH